jgi:hypothetical protein
MEELMRDKGKGWQGNSQPLPKPMQDHESKIGSYGCAGGKSSVKKTCSPRYEKIILGFRKRLLASSGLK